MGFHWAHDDPRPELSHRTLPSVYRVRTDFLPLRGMGGNKNKIPPPCAGTWDWHRGATPKTSVGQPLGEECLHHALHRGNRESTILHGHLGPRDG